MQIAIAVIYGAYLWIPYFLYCAASQANMLLAFAVHR